MAVFDGDWAVGPYEVTFNGTTIGLMEGPIRHQQQVLAQAIRASLYGQTILDYILQGAMMAAVLVVKEWDAGAKAALWQFGADHGIVNEAGLLFSPLYKALVLTALSGTPAATEGPVTRTYPFAGLLPGHNLDITFGPEERNIPMVFTFLPEPSGSGSKKARFFTDT